MFLFASLPIFEKFTITDRNSGKIVYLRDLEKAAGFYISFIHSVNRTPVEEYYRVSGNKFIVYKTVFESYGAGMPELTGPNVVLKNGKITISDIGIELSEFSVFVGTVASHKIVFDDEALPLELLSPPQTLLNFKIKKVSMWQILTVNF